MDFIAEMQSYFRGEKLEALIFIVPAGLAFAVYGVVALKAEQGGYAWGIAVPCLIFALILTLTGATVAAQTTGQVAGIEQGYNEAPAEMLTEELPRMQAVMKNFKNYLGAMGALAVIGLALRFLVPFEWAAAAGPVLLVAAGIGLVIDGVAERRAHPYITALEQIAADEK